MLSSGEIPKQYNEFEVANCVTKACAWDDNSADFVFADGTVLSFCDSMATFVAVTSRGDASYNGMTSMGQLGEGEGGEQSPMVASTRDMMLTHLALSKYEEKVRSALTVFNRFSQNPRVIVGLTKQQGVAVESSLGMDEQASGLRWLENALTASAENLESTQDAAEKSSNPLHEPKESQHELLNATRAAIVSRRESIDKANSGLYVWRENSPIDALVLCKTRDLFEVMDDSGRCRLWCALRRISLTLHANGETFDVCWPARATERDGTSYFFATPMNEYDELVSSVATQRVCHYVWLEQTFPVLRAPDAWKVMLQMAMELRAECVLESEQQQQQRQHVNEDGSPTSKQSITQAAASVWEEGAHYCSTTPSLAEPNLSCNLPKLGSARHHLVHFSKIQPGDAHALVASSQMQSLSINQRLRPQSVSLAWRFDGDPLGRVPNAVYWDVSGRVSESEVNGDSKRAPPRGCAVALVLEDCTAVVAAPQGRDYVVQHILREGVSRVYHQAADGNVNLPAVVLTDNPATQTEKTARIGETSYGKGRYLPFVGTSLIQISRCILSAKHNDVASNTFSQSSARTYYHNQQTAFPSNYPAAHQETKVNDCSSKTDLPREESGADGVELPTNAVSAPKDATQASNRQPIEKHVDAFDNTIIEKYVNEPLRIVPSHVQDGVVLLTSRIDGVGSFTAMTNGVCRGHFDDRTIVTMYPHFPSHLSKDGDPQFAVEHALGAPFMYESGFGVDEENLVAHAIFRDATQNTLRVQRCLPHNPMYRYLAYLIPFRRFARLSPRDRAALPSAIEEQTMALSDGMHARYTEVEMESEKRRRRIDELLRANSELSTRNRTVLSHPLYVSRSQPASRTTANLDAECDGSAVGREGWRWEAHRTGNDQRSTNADGRAKMQQPLTSAYFLDGKIGK